MIRTSLLVAFVSLSVLAGCAAQKQVEKPSEKPVETAPVAKKEEAPPATPTPEENKQKLLEMLKREQQQLSMQTFSIAGKTIQVEASAAPTVKQGEGAFQLIMVPIGTEQPLTCFLYAQPLSSASALKAMIDEVGKSVDIQGVRPWAVEVVEKHPAIFLEVAYFADQNGQKALGQLKLMSLASDETPLLCTHDEPGYVKTFQRIASGLAASMSKANPPEKAPKYSEVHTLTLGEVPFGFEHDQYFEGKDGGLVETSSSSMLMSRGKSDLRALDTANEIELDKNGRIAQRKYARVEDGEVSMALVLKRQGANEYTVEGSARGQPQTGKFSVQDKKGITGDVVVAQLTKEFLKGKAKELKLELYSPAENPTAASKTVVTKDPSRTNGISIAMGEMAVRGVVDDNGMVEELDIPAGANAEVLQKRVFKEGSLPGAAR